LNLDLSKFRKAEAGNKHTVLEHENGHILKIAHHGLSPEFRKQLEEMPVQLAKGGKVHSKWAQKNDPNIIKKDLYTKPPGKGVGPEAAGLSEVSKSSQPSKDPSYNEPQDQGTTGLPKLQRKPVSEWNVSGPALKEKPMYPPCINPSCRSFGHSHPNCRCYGGNEYAYERHAEGGEVGKQYFCDKNRPHFKGCELYKDGGGVKSDPEKLADASAEFSNPMPQVSSMVSDQQPYSSSQPVPTPLPAPQSSQETNPNPEMQGNESVPEPEPVSAQSQPDSDQQQMVTPQQEPPTPADAVMQHKDRIMNEIYPEAQAFKADLDNGHIKPETYSDLFNKKDTLGKIGTIFGLLLSGAGSGLAHQNNNLMTMMDKEIQRDLEAQQQSSTNKQNFLKINQQNIMNKAQASNLTQEAKTKAYALSRMQMNQAAFHKLVTDTQKLPPGSPQRMQAEQPLAMMNQGIQNENFNIADRAASAGALSTYLGGGQEGNAPNTTVMKSGLLGPEAKEVGTDIEEKSVPGFKGRAAAPLNPTEKNDLNKYVQFDQQVARFRDWAKNHSGVLPTSPQNIAIINQGKTLARQLQSTYREAALNTVYRPGEQGLLSQTIPDDPTKFLNKWRVLPQLDALRNENMAQLNTIAKQKGFKGYQGIQSPEQGQEQVKVVNGVKYKRGPNGEAIKVQ
jgi:hypothetical protein